MGKVVYNGNAVSRADNFQPAVRAEKTLQGFGGDKFVNAEQRAGGDGGQSVGDVKPSDEFEAESSAVKFIFRAVGQRSDMVGRKVGAPAFNRKCQIGFVRAADISTGFAVGIDNDTAAGAPCEVGKKLAEFFNRFVVEGNVVDKRDIWVIFSIEPSLSSASMTQMSP